MMKSLLLPLAVTIALSAAPASANEAQLLAALAGLENHLLGSPTHPVPTTLSFLCVGLRRDDSSAPRLRRPRLFVQLELFT